jgi:hypothetical protein
MFSCVKPPAGQRVGGHRNLVTPIRAVEDCEPDFPRKREAEQEVIYELRTLGAKGTIGGVMEVVSVTTLRGPASAEDGEPHEEEAFTRCACFPHLPIAENGGSSKGQTFLRTSVMSYSP